MSNDLGGEPPPGDLLPGECVLWRGRPSWRALARDLLHIRWIALYFAAFLIWNAHTDRSDGLGPMQTLGAGVPLFTLAAVVLGACATFAWLCARTTEYTITTERCIISFGIALTARLSMPLRRIASVSVAVRRDGTGNIPLAPKPGWRIAYLKLWPHARPWNVRRPHPMLLGVPDAAHVAAVLSTAIATVSAGKLSPLPPAQRRAPVLPLRPIRGPWKPTVSRARSKAAG